LVFSFKEDARLKKWGYVLELKASIFNFDISNKSPGTILMTTDGFWIDNWIY
jgi:hypothetical protein